jgi:hypothetical protein
LRRAALRQPEKIVRQRKFHIKTQHSKGETMKYLSSGRVVMAGLAATALMASIAATTSPAMAKAPKPEPTIPAAAQALNTGPKGATAGTNVHTGTPSGKWAAVGSQDGLCDVGDLCLYYVSAPTYGSGYDAAHNDQNLFNNRFIFAGSGQRAIVGNNAEAYWNRDPRAFAYVCTEINYGGSCGWLAPNSFGNLNSTYSNKSDSVFWGDSTNL